LLQYFISLLIGRNFNTKVALSDHERSDCGKNPIYTCKECNKSFHSAGSLKCHVKIHTREFNFFCEYCSKKFRTKGQLIIHERTHTKEKPFKCQFPNCNASFSHRESILTHNTIHTGIKRYECNKCNLQFSCISNLLAHKRSRKEKSCDDCKIQKVQNAKTTLRSVTAT
jgi:KRAB domain-containing zinc finger protein